MGLFDGMNPGSGILGGLADYLYPNAGGTAVNGMDFGAPGMNFTDRWPAFSPSAPIAPQAGQPGMPFGDRWSPISAGMANGAMTQGMPPTPDPGLQQVSPQAMDAWRQGVGNPAQNAPGMDQMPPMAQPVSGQAPPGMPTPQPPQGGQMPSALNGLPIPQMPSMPSFGGSAQAQTAPGAPGQPTPMDRLGAGMQGFFNGGGVLPAIGNLVGGIMTGQRQDAQGYGRQQTQQAQQAAYQAVKSAGGTEGQALAAASSPEVFKALAPELFGGFKLVKTGSNPITGDQFMMQGPGGKLHPLSEFTKGGAGGESDVPGGNGMLAPGVKYNPSLTGDDYLNQFGPEVQAAVKTYMQGGVMPTGNPRLQGIGAIAKTIAQKVGMDKGEPVTDASYQGKRQMITGLNQGTPGSLGGQITFAGTSLAHLSEAAKKIEDLHNVNGLGIAPLAKLVNMARELTTEQAGKANAVQGATQHYGQEVTKFYAGSPGGEGERTRFMKSMSTAKSPTELADALQTERDLIPGRLDQLENQIRTNLGEDSPDGKKALSRIEEAKKSIPAIDASIARLRGEKSAPVESKTGGVTEGATATNPKTGQKAVFKGGKWVPVSTAPAMDPNSL